MKSNGVFIDLKTNSLAAKLRAIAKHSNELANELEAIDAMTDSRDERKKSETDLIMRGEEHG